MSKKWMILSGMLFLGVAGTSQASPMDSPDIVYIDGLPCNSACQSYMAWSRNALSRSAQSAPAKPAQPSAKAAARRVASIRGDKAKPAAHAHAAKRSAPNSAEVPVPGEAQDSKVAGLQSGPAATQPAPAQPAPAASQAASNASPDSNTTQAKPADSVSTGASAAGSNMRTVQEQVTAAMAVAERMTVATAVLPAEPKADADRSDQPAPAGDAQKTAAASSTDTDLLVALVMARPEIKSVSDLTGKDVAIDQGQSASNGNLRTAIAAAGATEVQLSEGQAKAINRLISGEVPAAVLALVAPEAAESFPDIKGYKIFRIPLSPRSL